MAMDNFANERVCHYLDIEAVPTADLMPLAG